jgi:hypothetical protein
MWPTIHAEGIDWEVRVIAGDGEQVDGAEILEFRPTEQTRPPRRLAIRAGAINTADETALRSAFVQARPIGGDHYGRPGKRMSDI